LKKFEALRTRAVTGLGYWAQARLLFNLECSIKSSCLRQLENGLVKEKD